MIVGDALCPSQAFFGEIYSEKFMKFIPLSIRLIAGRFVNKADDANLAERLVKNLTSLSDAKLGWV